MRLLNNQVHICDTGLENPVRSFTHYLRWYKNFSLW